MWSVSREELAPPVGSQKPKGSFPGEHTFPSQREVLLELPTRMYPQWIPPAPITLLLLSPACVFLQAKGRAGLTSCPDCSRATLQLYAFLLLPESRLTNQCTLSWSGCLIPHTQFH